LQTPAGRASHVLIPTWFRPTFYGTEQPRKSIIPVVMAGVLGIYGLITAVIINGTLAGKPCKTMAFCDGETALV